MLLRLSRTRAVLCSTIIRPASRARYASGGAYFRNALIGGAVGGVAVCGVIIGTGYSVYHFSGAKVVVDTVKPAMALMSVSKERLAERAPKQALDSLRQAAKAYVAFFPGAGFLVDRSFDAVDGVVEEHGQEATSIIMKAYDDMLEIMQKGGNDHKASSAMEVISVARRLVQELSALGLKAGQPYAERLRR
ncbi:hypothetical protein CPC08DRAFT_723654 [Agrocybe pediades]|nr:hypothetical protein CPC08DRAFT_723654 [Agrocybe pediades]